MTTLSSGHIGQVTREITSYHSKLFSRFPCKPADFKFDVAFPLSHRNTQYQTVRTINHDMFASELAGFMKPKTDIDSDSMHAQRIQL